MKASLSSLSPRALLALVAGGVLLWAIVLWLLYVSPQRSDAAKVGEDLAAAELELAQAQVASRHPGRSSAPASEVFRLVKAMPESGDQSGLVLEVTRLAALSGISLRSISSQPTAEGPGGTTMIPVTVTVGGKYRQITRFLQRMRTLVSVRRGRLRATGRLFSVQDVELAESLSGGFPQLDATIVVDAFVYDGPIEPETPVPGATPEESSPTSTAAPGGTGS